MIKTFKNKSLTPSNLSPSLDPTEIQNIISLLCPSYCQPEVGFQDASFPPENKLLSRDITLKEVNDVISKLNLCSSPGMDSISYRMIYYLPSFMHNLLVNLFNNILFIGEFSTVWRKVIVFLLPKSIPGKLRPISLTSCLLKIMEKVIASCLQWWVESKGIISKTQYGFRQGKLCYDNLSLLSIEICTGLALAQYTPCIFIDVKGAFDNLLPELLLDALRQLNILERLCKFIYNNTSFRILHFLVNNSLAEPYFTYKGVLQGSVLSPLLFNLYINNLHSSTTNNCKLLQFADDTVIYNRRNDIEKLLQDLSSATLNISKFLENLGLEISPISPLL